MSEPARDLEESLGAVEALVREVEDLPDETAREKARGVVAAVLDLHAAALARILAAVAARDGAGGLLDALARDELVSSVLVLHDLHPRDREARVSAAIDSLRTGLVLRGARAEVTAIGEDAIAVRVVRERAGCASEEPRLRAMVEEALARAAPEVKRLEVTVTTEVADAFIPVSRVRGEAA